MSEIAIQAPLSKRVIEEVMRDHPEIDTFDEESPSGRARILDYACARLNKPGQTTPWGRKARKRVIEHDPTTGINLNTDALCFLRADGRFEIVDVINGTDGKASWHNYGPFDQGANGYWAPALTVDNDDKPGPVPRPEPKPNEPAKPVPSRPKHDYTVQLELTASVIDILAAKGSHYFGNARAQGAAAGHLVWKVQFEDYPIQHALDNANRRARGEEAE